MIKLINGDCFQELKSLEQNSIDCVICDPPYNIDYADWDSSFNITGAVELLVPLLKENANIIIFQGWSNVVDTKMILDKHFQIQNWIIWDRIKGRGSQHNLMSTREDILWYSNGPEPTFNKVYSNTPKKTTGRMGLKNGQVNRSLTNVWYDLPPVIPWSKEKTSHPTQKPLELMERCIKLWSNPGDTVLDFTMGSGTTGVACLNLARNFIGIEIDKEYFNLARERILGKRSNINLIKGLSSDIAEEGNTVIRS